MTNTSTTLLEEQVSSAFLDSDGSLYLYDKDQNYLEGWPVGWPERIGDCATFLKNKGIHFVNKPRGDSLLALIPEVGSGVPPMPAETSVSSYRSGILKEKSWVTDHLVDLVNLINDVPRFSLLSPEERQRLVLQRKIMFDLSDVLGERLSSAKF